jgi:hypothetical protein
MMNIAIAAKIVSETTSQSGRIVRFKLCIPDEYASAGAIDTCKCIDVLCFAFCTVQFGSGKHCS